MLQKENILIVDDDINILELIQRHLQSLGYHTYKAVSVKEAVAILRDTEIGLLITDLKMPEVDGFQLIQFASEHYPQMPKLVVTGYPSVQDALSVIKSGAVDYLVKPFTKEELKKGVLKSLAAKAKKKAIIPTSNNKYNEIIGESEAINNVTQIIERVKDNKATIFISGESGTGKELVARSIHYNGKFSRAPFIAVNCGGIPENLLESELFGYVKGAFTGANDNREGFFQAANGGTIFLDEIGNASLAVQSRLLRVLQEKEVVKVGSRKSEKIDVRVIAATNNNLREMIAKETFREDLFYRLSVFPLIWPALAERPEDILPLADFLLAKQTKKMGRTAAQWSSEAKQQLLAYHWPGNVRELDNIIQRALILQSGPQIRSEDLLFDHAFSSPSVLASSSVNATNAASSELTAPDSAQPNTADLEGGLKRREYEMIHQTLEACLGSRKSTAEKLGISARTLRYKMAKMRDSGIEIPA